MSFFKNDSKSTIKAIGIGTGISLALTMVFSCLITLIMLFIPSVPYEYVGYITLISYASGVFIGGYITAATAKERGLILGLLCGAAVFIISLIIGFIFDGGTITIMTPLRLAVLLLFGGLGGIKGVNRNEKIHIK